MSVIKIEDIAHVRFTAPDLEEMRRFLTAFGLTVIEGGRDGLYARGVGTAPFLHATHEGPAGFAGLGLRANSVGDLEILAETEGLAVADFEAPGGGKVVVLTDPDGRRVEVVAGQTRGAPSNAPCAPPRNLGDRRERERAPVRLDHGPSTILRLGHAVLNVADFRRCEAWYKERFGLITSDEIQAAPGHAIGAFLRCDRGETPTDHHTLFMLQSPAGPGFNHAAFEVAHFDDLMRGHDHLKRDGRKAAWGVGRHILGSQIFDYWKDPWGHELEHWTDGDVFTTADGSNIATMETLLGVQWGPLHPMMAKA